MTERPAIGETVIVRGYTAKPFAAQVRDYHQCASDCVRVVRRGTNEEWVVRWEHCWDNSTERKPNER